MNFSRRRFIGVVAAGTAGLAAPPGFAEIKIGERPGLLPRAMDALQTHNSRIAHRDIVGMVDFSMASDQPRFHLVDIAGGRIMDTILVAHGCGSDPANVGMVERFSNLPGSNASCNGSFVTGDIYFGKHGRSQRLIGLDQSNDEADSRGIVIHAASYVNNAIAKTQGRVGRSQGCFAVSQTDIGEMMERLGPGRLLFAWK
ncbi:murein L,D-transpeptidase catalytic domain family protein [Novosphingobium sp.]|uniref:murein L,D-transpeptidase catalytic domain family protein n=1 Tax=Novosphingobium sp. TaxID=1874826 RepID=UPI0025CD1885|nr:murein L,D-transpeptidase catalytic domain family protein [Novosphingobium sp.]